ncbi:hypothetical protein GCM10022379_34760 [Micromonospora maritima]
MPKSERVRESVLRNQDWFHKVLVKLERDFRVIGRICVHTTFIVTQISLLAGAIRLAVAGMESLL